MEQPQQGGLHETPAFRMHCMKVLPCPQRFAHDWVSCPFAHPGERARRRDPRLFSYTGVACPAIKQEGGCDLGDHCPYAHNVFEYWLHPTRYRTQLCSDGTGCHRRICFFAHSVEDLRTPSCKPFVRPDAVVAAAAAAASARKQRQPAGGGTAAAAAASPSSGGTPGLQQEAEAQQEAETPEEEHRRVVETVTWLLGRGEFSPEQAATLLRELLPARALEVLQAGLRTGGSGTGSGVAGAGNSDWHGAEGARRHSDPFGRQTGHGAGPSPGAAGVRFSLGSAAAASAAGLSMALAAPPPGLAACQLVPAQQQQAQQQQPQQGITDEMAGLLTRVAAVIQAHRNMAAAPSPLLPAYAAFGAECTAGPPRFSAPIPQSTYDQAAACRMSMDARLEAQLCAGFAVANPGHPTQGPPAGFAPVQQQQGAPPHAALAHAHQALPPGAPRREPFDLMLPANSWPCSVNLADLAPQGWPQVESYDAMLPSNSWPCAPGGDAPLPASLARLSLDASLAQAGLQGMEASMARHSMDASMARYSLDASVAQHGRHSMDARLAQHGWPGMDASRGRDSMDSNASGFTAGRVSLDLRMEAHPAAPSPRPPLPPPSVNPYTSSLFSSAAASLGPAGGSAGMAPAAPAAPDGSNWYSLLSRFPA